MRADGQKGVEELMMSVARRVLDAGWVRWDENQT